MEKWWTRTAQNGKSVYSNERQPSKYCTAKITIGLNSKLLCRLVINHYKRFKSEYEVPVCIVNTRQLFCCIHANCEQSSKKKWIQIFRYVSGATNKVNVYVYMLQSTTCVWPTLTMANAKIILFTLLDSENKR